MSRGFGTLVAAVVILGGAGIARADEAHLVSYGAFGTTEGVNLRGRVVRGAPPSGAHGKGKLRKAASTAHAFLRRDVEKADLVVSDRGSGRSWRHESDDEGFWDISIPGPLRPGKLALEIRLTEEGWEAPAIRVTADVVDAAAPGLVVISDIDDTIVETGVTGGKARMVGRVATSNAADMLPYPLAAATLRAFAEAGAPVIYLTAGPVELAPRTIEFLERNGFPPGAIFFRYYSEHGAGDPTAYKIERFDRILQRFPARQLALFGDNGEKDPELFALVAQRSKRVAAAYIRATLAAAPDEARYQGQILIESWRDIARHAGKNRLIRWMAAHRIALAARALDQPADR